MSDGVTTSRAQHPGTLSDRLIGRTRWIAIRGLAGVTSGVLVLGIGGRLVMLASRLLHPETTGRLTENGNRIGDFTVEGTLALLVFGGLAGGLFASVVWTIVKDWVPDNSLLVGLGAVAMGGFLLVEADNPDFQILSPPGLDLVLLLSLVFLFGVVLHRVDSVLERRLPSFRRVLSTAFYSLLVLVGVPLVIPTFGNFVSSDFCGCEPPPVWTGVLLAVTAVATIWWWILDLRGAESPPAHVRLLGRVATGAAVLAGGVHLTAQIVTIL